MKELKGTEKQIAWANDIRETAMSAMRIIEDSCWGTGSRGERIRIPYNQMTAEAIERVKNELTAAFDAIDSASVIINKRSIFAYDALLERTQQVTRLMAAGKM